jgi:ETC complex I subunit conserved region
MVVLQQPWWRLSARVSTPTNVYSPCYVPCYSSNILGPQGLHRSYWFVPIIAEKCSSSVSSIFPGLAVHPNPLPALRTTLESTLQTLSAIPEASVYRQATTAIIQRRLAILDRAKGNVSVVEKQIDQGQIEEVLKAAEDELSLAGKMIEWKAWVSCIWVLLCLCSLSVS